MPFLPDGTPIQIMLTRSAFRADERGTDFGNAPSVGAVRKLVPSDHADFPNGAR